MEARWLCCRYDLTRERSSSSSEWMGQGELMCITKQRELRIPSLLPNASYKLEDEDERSLDILSRLLNMVHSIECNHFKNVCARLLCAFFRVRPNEEFSFQQYSPPSNRL